MQTFLQYGHKNGRFSRKRIFLPFKPFSAPRAAEGDSPRKPFSVIQIMIKNQNSFRENRGVRDVESGRRTSTKPSCIKRRKTVEQSEKNNETESRKSDFPRKTRKLYQETGEYLTSFACTATLPLEKPLQVTRVIILSSSVNLNVPRDGISFNPCR